MIESDEYYMSRALHLAKQGLYTTHPNPRVGCVIVKGAKVVGEGWHERAGEPHAEVHALSAAGELARGATAYVTLEPCSHYGRTPPCADALIQAGIAKVVVAMKDPNPKVAGRGLNRLRDAGIQVEIGLLEEQAVLLNRGFIKRMTSAMPWVRVKLAASLDGRTAMASGESQWITGEAARRDVQFLRARASCILTGSETVLHDNPSLNVRLTADELGISGDVRQPLRAIIDSQLRVLPDRRLFSLQGECLLYTLEKNINNNKYICELVHVKSKKFEKEKISLSAVLNDLANRGINEVHVEAGPTLCGALLSQNLVDEVVLYTAPHLMGNSAKPLFHLPGIEQMRDRLDFEFSQVRMVGKDLRLTLLPA